MYPILRRGDRLPTVATVQILINRKMKQGTYLVVDGIFGKNTRRELQNFQRRHGLDPKGKVNKDTWSQLIKDQDLQVIDSVDVTNPSDMGYEDAAIRGAGGDPIVNFGMCNGVKEVTKRILAEARPGRVALLRFHGHGSPGYMGIANGTGDEVSSEFGVTYLDSLARFLQQLFPIFAPFGCVELHGCRVGAGRDGRRLLTALSGAWNVPVTAGVRSQYGGGASTFKFEGPTISRFPGNVGLKKWAKSIDVPEVHGQSVSRSSAPRFMGTTFSIDEEVLGHDKRLCD